MVRGQAIAKIKCTTTEKGKIIQLLKLNIALYHEIQLH